MSKLNIPVDVDAVNIANDIYGPDVGIIKGRSTRKQPEVVTTGNMEVPKSAYERYSNIELRMDALKICGVWFLATISKGLNHWTMQHVKTKTMDQCGILLDEVLRLCDDHPDFKVVRIRCDNKISSAMCK